MNEDSETREIAEVVGEVIDDAAAVVQSLRGLANGAIGIGDKLRAIADKCDEIASIAALQAWDVSRNISEVVAAESGIEEV